ncbi:heparinase II/III domain-containing protein [Thiocystis violacea]|uniref:heparinase II/III domain-containing protein n=1 Tax=Thiocystis violacea TaxID=13725 RepID=UPI0019087EDD|nr:heparinase II/III family protein [Thiocystis violacea]
MKVYPSFPMKPLIVSLLLLTNSVFWAGVPWHPAQVQELKTSELISRLHEHPRLLLTDGRLSELRSLYPSDERLRSYIDALLESADGILSENWRPQYELYPPQFTILKSSRRMVKEIQTLGFAWRWTGKTHYLESAQIKLISVCDFPNWHSKHFLDTAEMAYAVGIGYDWFYWALPENQRHRIEECLIAKALDQDAQINRVFSDPSKSSNNWNVVTNAGLVVGSLAIAESYPDDAARFLEQAQRTLPNCLKMSSPDGSWREGVVYAKYLSTYLARLLSSAETSLGINLDVTDIPGVKRIPEFIISSVGPSGFTFNYADAGTKRRGTLPFLFYFGGKYGIDSYSNDEHSFLDSKAEQLSRLVTPEHLIWYQEKNDQADRSLRVSSVFESSDVTVAFLTKEAQDKNAVWLAVKAGQTLIPHGQADQGQFVIDALGERWVIDLGADNYGLPGYWDSDSSTGKRWSYLRLGSAGHNVPTLAGYHQAFDGKGVMENCSFSNGPHFCEIDLTHAYPRLNINNFAYRRRVEVGDNKASVVDCFEGDGSLPIVWKFYTDADVSVRSDGIIVLTKGAKTFYARIFAPNAGLPRIDLPESNPPEFSLNGAKRISLDTVLEAGNNCITTVYTLNSMN